MHNSQEQYADARPPQDKQKAPAEERERGVGHGSGDRNEDQYLNDTDSGEPDPGPRGRAASGESYEDEADNALFRAPTKQGSVKTYDGGDLGPGGEVLPDGGDPSRHKAGD